MPSLDVRGPLANLTPLQAGLIPPSVIYMPDAAGAYYSVPGSTTSVLPPEAAETAAHFVAGTTRAIDRLACFVTAGGSAGAKIRLGLRAWNLATMRPGAVLIDSGQLAAEASATVIEATVAYTLVAGTSYALTLTVQGGATTRPGVPCITSSYGVSLGRALPSPAGYAEPPVASGQTGALVDAPTWSVSSVVVPRVWMRSA